MTFWRVLRYVGSAPVTQSEGEIPIKQAVTALKESISAATKGKKGPVTGVLAELVISQEGVLVVDRVTRDTVANVIVKAVSCVPSAALFDEVMAHLFFPISFSSSAVTLHK